jgi:3,4-dihydroxy 2-butanone 4-phosphate synthase / GTP cyclohydrolase II
MSGGLTVQDGPGCPEWQDWQGLSAGSVVTLDGVPAAIDALRRGLPVVVVDDADRENEGDIILAAANATPEWIGWTVRHTSGVICAPMPDRLADRLGLPLMVERNEESLRTAYTVSVDARAGVRTGISAADRSTTLRLLAGPDTKVDDLVRPGHIFPLRARPGGVLERRGHTEAAVDLCRLAGLPPVGVLAEVVTDEGPVTRLPGLRALADAHGLPLISVADLAAYRLQIGDGAGAPTGSATATTPARVPSTRVQRVAESRLPTRHGDFSAIAYRDLLTGHEHIALVAGTPAARGALVRVHSECLTGDAFGSSRCDCGPQLDAAMAAIALEGGAVVYLRGHEGRGIGLLAKLTAYQLQDAGLDTVTANTAQGLPVDAREYGAAAAILTDLGLDDVRLLTNNPAKVIGLGEHGVTAAERVPLQVGQNQHNRTYLNTKRDLMGHQLDLTEGVR